MSTTMTTYELIRQLAKLDPVGNKHIMLAVKYSRQEKDGTFIDAEASGFVEGFSVESTDENDVGYIVIESTDM